MANSFKSNPAGWRRLLKSRGAQDVTNHFAEEVAAKARANAPVDTGAYRDSIAVIEDPTPNRARASVVADISYGLVVESRENTLGKAL